MSEQLAKLLARRLGERFKRNELLSDYTTFGVGGPAWGLVEPDDEDELAFVLRAAAEAGMELQVLGACSNVLVADSGLPALAVLIRERMGAIELESQSDRGVLLRVDAGCSVRRLTELCLEHGWTGFEFAAGIPGNLGGALRMNAGTRDGEIYDLVRELRLMNAEGSAQWLAREEVDFSYRAVELPAGAVILSCRMELQKGERQDVARKVEAMLAWRAEHHPQYLPCAGSVFRNPPGEHAARLIETAGCKGLRVGGAQVSEHHANFIVNDKNGSANDIYELIGLVRQRVRQSFGLTLECEVKLLGDFA
ncbi:MAG: UDP-N-acetylmuramate dehydrogenase [Candidatus Alcyoniella australis]|nr:UDP-N-acetylmuramate dehydrogenase [Candidatus Alcyoniella australis]